MVLLRWKPPADLILPELSGHLEEDEVVAGSGSEDNPRELLREQGSPLALRRVTAALALPHEPVPVLAEEWLLLKGQIPFLDLAEPPVPPLIRFLLFLISSNAFSPALMRSFHLFEWEAGGALPKEELGADGGCTLVPGSERQWETQPWLGIESERRSRGRTTPSTKSSSAVRKSVWQVEGFLPTIQNSNSGEEVQLLLALGGSADSSMEMQQRVER